jgi:hypothetical protein
MKRFYLLTGSVFSFVYLVAGIAFLTGKLDFGLSNNTRIATGCVLIAYGAFRVFMFYKRIRNSGTNENE